MKWLATWIMNRIARDDSSEWALVMRREFDELESEHFGWALGRWIAKLHENEAGNLELITSLLAVHFFGPIFAMLLNGLPIAAGFTSLTYVVAFCYPVPWAILLGIRHPNSMIFISSIGGVVLPFAIGYPTATFIFNVPQIDFFPGESAMLTGLSGVGFLSSLALWYACTSIGVHIAGDKHPARQI